MKSSRIEYVAPNLKEEDYRLTSPETDSYNCIAWAVYDTRQWWWPTPRYACYWPPGAPRNNSLDAVCEVFRTQGYSRCEDQDREIGFEKIAIYEIDGFGVEHVARQLQSGEWTSKIGEWEDICHPTPQSLEGEEYGRIKAYMKRRRKEWTS